MALAGAFAVGFLAMRPEQSATTPAAVMPVFHHGPIFGYGPVVAPEPPERPPLALEQVRLALAQAYYRHVSPLWLTEPTIEGILEKVGDPYTEYLSPAEYEELQDRLSRQYYGVGLRVGREEGGLVVIASYGAAAQAAGIQPGDVIVSIDGQPASGLPFDRSVALMKGEGGTTVRLTVQRPGRPKPLEFELERGPVSLPAVRSRLMRSGGHEIGYVRLVSFSADAAERVGKATRKLVERGADALILDLRGDPGGYVTQAIRVASLYLERGIVCSTTGVNQESRVFTVSGAAVEIERPLAVLVDHDTASASEIVAGALRDHHRAVVVGERTFGKATVQSIVALSDGGALKLTTATYVTPAGRSIGGRGIKPKVKAVDDPATRPDEAVVAARQAMLEQLAAA